MSKRIFTTAATEADPVEFDLNGRLLDGGTFTETFRCIPALSPAVIKAFGQGAINAVEASRLAAAGVIDTSQIDLIYAFFDTALADDDAARFRQVVDDKNHLVGIPDLRDIIEWIVEELTGRPTSGRSASPGGSSSTPNTSTAASSSAATPPPPSAPSQGPISLTSPSRSSRTASPSTPTSPRSSRTSKRASSTRRTSPPPPKPTGSTVSLTPPL